MILTGSGSGKSQGRELLKAMSTVIPSEVIGQVLTECGKSEKRRRDLPSDLIVRLVIALGLLVDCSTRSVLGFLLPDGKVASARQSIRQACYRVGPVPLRELMRALGKPLATKSSVPEAFYQGLHVFALDAANLKIADSEANEHAFGRPGVSRGKAAFPQVKLTALAETGTHYITDAEIRPGRRNEQLPGLKLVERHACKGRLFLWDAGFYSFRLVTTILSKGAHFIGCAKANNRLDPIEILEDGSWLTKIYPTWSDRRKDRNGVIVRAIRYKVGKKETTIITSLLDPELYSAQSLAELYHERWEIETTFDEFKTHQQGRPNGHAVPIRAQIPRGVVQEIYGLILAHRVIRTLMTASACATDIDPDRIPFKNTLIIVRRYLPKIAQAKPQQLSPLLPIC